MALSTETFAEPIGTVLGMGLRLLQQLAQHPVRLPRLLRPPPPSELFRLRLLRDVAFIR